jgi:cystathionine beta-synthase
MVEAAQREGWRVVVEATAGNTGIALAQQCRARNMHLIVCLPDTTATQKIEVLRVLGVEVAQQCFCLFLF